MGAPAAPEYSRFARTLLQARPELAVELAAGGPWTRAAMQEFIAAGDPRRLAEPGAPVAPGTPGELGRRLRQLRARVMLRLIQRDLAGQADLAEVCGCMTALAELSIAAGLAALTAGEPGPGLMVVGMGKLGGGELNVSSDIDLVFVYAAEADQPRPGKSRQTHHEYFSTLGKRLIALLGQPTEDGPLFRIDMRLRPWGDAGPLAVSVDALEQYLVVHGREWERYAWIKGRPLSGSAEEQAQLAAVTRPFVFRKYLDYGAIAAMRDLHAQIREEVERREFADHVKLGPGGIREIEFIAQAHQLIRGGREADLQARPTQRVLALLAERRLLPPRDVAALLAAYDFLRRTEHRIQYLDDAQTHELPEDAADRALLARSMGCGGWKSFTQALDRHRGEVSRQFEQVFAAHHGDGGNRGSHPLAALWPADGSTESAAKAEVALGPLENLGYGNADAVRARLVGLRRSARYQSLPAQSKPRFDALVPLLIERAAAAATTGEARDATLARLLDLLEAISRRAAYLALLDEHPAALTRLARLLAASSWAAEYLSRHPIVLDELLAPQLLVETPDWREIGAALRQNLAAAEGDQERQMDIIRETHHAQLFRLLARDLEGALSVEKLADHLSALADLMLEVTLELCWRQLPRRHRAAGEAPRFAIVAYGKLGGKELGYASDLDLIFLFDDADEAAPEVYARLAQRFNLWLTSRTPAGLLFETDFRLRPNGAGGLLVSSLDAFRRYQRESAWVWEHQALTRARFCAGDAGIGAAFEAERRAILCLDREPLALAAEVRDMRETMREGHPNRGELFDLKHDPGGMVDIEFIVQFLVLAHARRHERLTLNHGNIALLGYAAELGLIPAGAATAVQEAYRVFRRLQHGLRLAGARYARVPPDEVAPHVAAALGLWRAVLGAQPPAGR